MAISATKNAAGTAEELMDNRTVYDPSSANFRLENSPFYLMAHADFKYHEDMDVVLHKHGVSKPIYRVMTVLRERQPASIGAIAEAALTKRSTISRIIDRMVEQGLVTTEPNPEDHRITEVTLTPAGQQTLRKLTPIVGRQFSRAMNGVSDRDIAHLLRTLQKISGNLSKLPIE
ncbi:MarR family winged helix-turn-helix transcriptional regulator [Sphingomonas soli]|uniref:MarR family winged helix-turn-helix transcriptional regulator n=1 Tax=Sphingomonas soli TaxID=266127 RepID=UPI000A024796|nr:MarR family transcriptional regulator [Sphingomonas soli]